MKDLKLFINVEDRDQLLADMESLEENSGWIRLCSDLRTWLLDIEREILDINLDSKAEKVDELKYLQLRIYRRVLMQILSLPTETIAYYRQKDDESDLDVYD